MSDNSNIFVMLMLVTFFFIQFDIFPVFVVISELLIENCTFWYYVVWFWVLLNTLFYLAFFDTAVAEERGGRCLLFISQWGRSPGSPLALDVI